MQDAKVLRQETVFEGRIIRVDVEHVQLPNGNRTTLDLVRHPGAAAVVPICDDGTTLLVRQYRHAVGRWLLEVPAGKLDGAEDPATCAKRELEEEVGCKAAHLIPLGSLVMTPGFADERIWLFAATGLTRIPQRLEADEVLTIETMALSEAAKQAQRGDIEDAKSVCALLRAQVHLRTHGSG